MGLKQLASNNVMKAAKMAKGAFYYHYKDKYRFGIELIKVKTQERVYEGMIFP